MSELDSEDAFHVGNDVMQRAIEVINLLRDFADVPYPKILPEGEDSLSLTWKLNDFKQFLTIYNDELERTIYNGVTGIRCIEQISEGSELSLHDVTKIFPLKVRSRTAE
ncbi:hypothetical protein D3P04_13590 [Paracoccus onubensis]|uniref:Uncharacterized protein n=2 Tax=Paracoccus onubensis TaxID=1675788 RepID=A0A418SSV7_9RHOB|nr:hypothetical protein D3P04_13590 [Paracoccus onubensis]